MRRLALALLLLFSALAPAAAADVARTRDGARWLVSKSQSDGDWLVTYDASRATVSGSVLEADGGAVLIDCDVIGVYLDRFALRCFYAPASNSWAFLADTEVSRAFLGDPAPPFFQPTPGPTVAPTPRPSPRPTPRPTPARPCPDVSGLYDVTASYTCGFGTGSILVRQSGCSLSGTIDSLNNLVPVSGFFSGSIDATGYIVGTVSLGGACSGVLPVEGAPDFSGRYVLPFEANVSCTGLAAGCTFVVGSLTVY